jgi:hypothetical protein
VISRATRIGAFVEGGCVAFTSSGLPGRGRTVHFQISYEDAASPSEGLERASCVMSTCEADFSLVASWFRGVDLEFPFPIIVQIADANLVGTWRDPPDIASWCGFSPTVSISLRSGMPAIVVRYLLVLEVSKMFMAAQTTGWYEPTSLFGGAGESGRSEGLARFLGGQFLIVNGLPPVPPPGWEVVPLWLNGQRANFVDAMPGVGWSDEMAGCATCFLYFLHDQLGFGVCDIVRAGGNTLEEVFRKLTGDSGGFETFSRIVNAHYPPGEWYTPASDNIFPVSELCAFQQPAQVSCGRRQTTFIVIDKPAMAQVNVSLRSGMPNLLRVPGMVTIPVGATSVSLCLEAAGMAGPFEPLRIPICASYAGKIVTTTAEVVPPRPNSLTLSPAVVVCGDCSTATLTLDVPSPDGPVKLDVACTAPRVATVPTEVTVDEGQASVSFVIATPRIAAPSASTNVTIYATYAGKSVSAVLRVDPAVIAGIVRSVVLPASTVKAGETIYATATLQAPVSSPTTVSLTVMDVAQQVDGDLRLPGEPSNVAKVPGSVVIPAGLTTRPFPITTRPDLPAGSQRRLIIVAAAIVEKYAMLAVCTTEPAAAASGAVRSALVAE